MPRTSTPLARTAIVGAALGATAALVPSAANAANENAATATYVITVENLTPAGSQPLSPVGTVVHSNKADVWEVGEPASDAVAAVAEDALLPVFVDAFDGAPGVRSASVGGAGPIVPGASAAFEIQANPGDLLSLTSMLVNTNDAFTGLDGVRLAKPTQVFEVGAYDAGSEINNELAAFIPGPVGGNVGVRAPENGVITPSTGILGVGDVDPEVYDWDDPVARITIERIGR